MLHCWISGLTLSQSSICIPTNNGNQVITVDEYVTYVKIKRDKQLSKRSLYHNMIQERQNAMNNHRLIQNNILTQNLQPLPPHPPVNNDITYMSSSNSNLSMGITSEQSHSVSSIYSQVPIQMGTTQYKWIRVVRMVLDL